MLPKLTCPQRQTSMQEDIDKHSLGAQLLFFSEKGHLALVDFFPDRVSCASHVSQHYCGLAAWTTSMTITPNSRTPFAANWVFQNGLAKSQNCPLVPQVFFLGQIWMPLPQTLLAARPNRRCRRTKWPFWRPLAHSLKVAPIRWGKMFYSKWWFIVI